MTTHSTTKLTYEYVKSFIEGVDGYKLLSTKYINSKKYLKIQCQSGHIFNMSWSHFKEGRRCTQCFKLTYKIIKENIEINGYKLLSPNYKNNYSKLKIMCPNNHIIYISYGNFQQGMRCKCCSDEKRRHKYDYVKNFIENKGYELLSNEYINNKTKLNIKCNKGHIFHPRFDNFKHKTECPKCSFIDGSSKPEKEIGEFIKNIYKGKIIFNDRTLIENSKTNKFLELDIWLPEINKAIEYNGEYYHNNKYSMWKDRYKQEWCNENKIELLVINHSDWIRDKNFNKIKNFIEA
jgi:hypothetical protein